MNEGTILAGQSHRATTVLIDQSDDFLIELAQYHLDDIHHFFVGDAHPLLEFAGDAHRLEQVSDLWSAPVHNHRIHSHQFEHHDIAGKAGLEMGLGHGVAAILDDDSFVMKALDVRQRLGQDLRLECRRTGLDGR